MSSRADDERLVTMQHSAADFSDGVRVTKIDRNVAILHSRLDRVAEVALRNDIDFAIGPGEVDNRFPHASSRADEQHARRRLHLFCSNSSTVLRKRAWFASLISHNGKRTSPDIAPRQPRAVFTGTGFGSMNKSLNNGSNFRCNFSADFKSADSQARTSAHTCEGNRFDATLTTPAAPTAMKGSVSESSPLKTVNDSGKRRRRSLTRSTLPLASLIERILRHSFAKRTTVSGLMSTPHRPGML